RRHVGAFPEPKQTKIISIICAIVRRGEVEALAASLYLPPGYPWGVPLGNGHPLRSTGWANQDCLSAGCGTPHKGRPGQSGDGGFTRHVPAAPCKAGQGGLCALARGHHRAGRLHRQHAEEPGARCAADRARGGHVGRRPAACAAACGAAEGISARSPSRAAKRTSEGASKRAPEGTAATAASARKASQAGAAPEDERLGGAATVAPPWLPGCA